MTTISRRGLFSVAAAATVGGLASAAQGMAVLPQGLDKADFLRAVEAFRAIVGADNVLVDEARLVPYTQLMIPGELAQFEPAGALIVNSVEQVKAVLAVCNRFKVPVWPISTGRNFGYGEALPAVPGQMVLDLGRMNKIISVDADLCTAVVEPGVTYHQLYEYLQANDIPLWLAVPGPGPLVGPMGQVLERGQGYTAMGEQFESLCGMEVVLADGTLLRTGLGGVEGSKGWQSNKYGYGPYIDGMFTQSNFGIVTKLGFWLMPRPPAYKIFAASFDQIDDIGKAAEVARHLKLHHVVNGPMLMGMPMGSFQMSMKNRAAVVPDSFKGPTTRAFIEDYTAKNKLPRVGAFGALYGTEAEIAAKYAVVKEKFSAAGAMVVDELLLQLSPLFHHMVASLTGKPDLTEMNMMNWVGGGGCVWFAPIVPTRGEEVVLHQKLAWDIMLKHGFDYNGGFFHNGRSAIHAISILFDKGDRAATARAHACFDELLSRFAAQGYGCYRTNIAFMAQTADTFGPAQKATFLKLKRALDPNGVIAPGKSGIRLA